MRIILISIFCIIYFVQFSSAQFNHEDLPGSYKQVDIVKKDTLISDTLLSDLYIITERILELRKNGKFRKVEKVIVTGKKTKEKGFWMLNGDTLKLYSNKSLTHLPYFYSFDFGYEKFQIDKDGILTGKYFIYKKEE